MATNYFDNQSVKAADTAELRARERMVENLYYGTSRALGMTRLHLIIVDQIQSPTLVFFVQVRSPTIEESTQNLRRQPLGATEREMYDPASCNYHPGQLVKHPGSW